LLFGEQAENKQDAAETFLKRFPQVPIESLSSSPNAWPFTSMMSSAAMPVDPPRMLHLHNPNELMRQQKILVNGFKEKVGSIFAF